MNTAGRPDKQPASGVEPPPPHQTCQASERGVGDSYPCSDRGGARSVNQLDFRPHRSGFDQTRIFCASWARPWNCMRSQLSGTAHDCPRRVQHSRKFGERKNEPWFSSTPRHPNQLTIVKSLLNLRVLSAVYQESKHSDCQNTCDNANQCCRIHLMYPPFSQSRVTGKLYKQPMPLQIITGWSKLLERLHILRNVQDCGREQHNENAGEDEQDKRK
jgi:hypothetical protein